MQAIQNPVNRADQFFRTLYQNIGWLVGIILAFFVGMAVNNGDATHEAVHQVQSTYQDKLEYHRQHEQILAKSIAKVRNACEHNAATALHNDVSPQVLTKCPPPPGPAAK